MQTQEAPQTEPLQQLDKEIIGPPLPDPYDEEPILDGVITEEIPAPDLANEPDRGVPLSEETTTLEIIPTIVIPPPEPEWEEPPRLSFWQRIRWPLLAAAVLLCCFGAGMAINILWLTPAQATILLVPARSQRSLTLNLTPFQMGLRTLPPLIESQSKTVPTTGIGHQPAVAASGWVTLYNAALFPQTIAAGTLIQGHDGVAVTTDYTRTIPAGTISTKSSVEVKAHATQTGPEGNIAAGDLYGPCCRDNVFADNAAFGGGQSAATYQAVTTQDIQGAARGLTTKVEAQTQTALQAQLQPGESLVKQACAEKTTSSAQPGESANQVTVMVTESCKATDVYNANQVGAQLTAGSPGFVLANGETPTIHIEKTTTPLWTVQVSGSLVYQWDALALQRLARELAGKSRSEAQAILAQQPGIAQARISISGREQDTMPDAGQIAFSVLQ